jgi:hypothetical protein
MVYFRFDFAAVVCVYSEWGWLGDEGYGREGTRKEVGSRSARELVFM